MRRMIQRICSMPFMSIGVVIINIILFLICTFTGNLLYNKGSISVLDIYKGEYFRLISSMFLHMNMEHLANNMLLLFGLGMMLEKELGHIRFGIYYFLAGISGNVLSVLTEHWSGQYVRSIGASGAVFGIDGVLLALVLFADKKIENVTLPRVVFMIGYSIYSGFAADNINNAAHIGGLLAGFILASMLCLVKKMKKARKHSEMEGWFIDEY